MAANDSKRETFRPASKFRGHYDLIKFMFKLPFLPFIELGMGFTQDRKKIAGQDNLSKDQVYYQFRFLLTVFLIVVGALAAFNFHADHEQLKTVILVCLSIILGYRSTVFRGRPRHREVLFADSVVRIAATIWIVCYFLLFKAQ